MSKVIQPIELPEYITPIVNLFFMGFLYHEINLYGWLEVTPSEVHEVGEYTFFLELELNLTHQLK